MNTAFSSPTRIPSSLERMGLSVQFEPLSCSARYFHISAPDEQSSLVLAIPITLTDDTGVAHVLEHLLLTGSSEPGGDSLFFRTRAESSAVDMNAVTNSRYLAVHFTCNDFDEYLRLLQRFTSAIFQPNWQADQLKKETGTRVHPGIITNEMAGVFSVPELYWTMRAYAGLFVEGSGQFNPGGDPDRIADVDQEKLDAFWKQQFSPANLIVVSYGEISPDHVREKLEQCLSGFSAGVQHKIVPSVPFNAPRVSKLLSTLPSDQPIASGMLLQPNDGDTSGLEVELLRSFFRRYAEAISASAGRFGIKFNVSPEVKEVDGDSLLFTLCTFDFASKPDDLWSIIADSCDAVIRGLSYATFAQLNQSALHGCFSLGNEKFGTGVAASFELLDALCGSISSKALKESASTVDSVLNGFCSRSSWMELFDRAIRSNPAQIIMDCDDAFTPINSKFTTSANIAEADCIPCVKIIERQVMEDTKFTRQATAVDRKPNAGWHIPEIGRSNISTIYHYRLPRPRISTLKVCVHLPEAIVETIGFTALHTLPNRFMQFLDRMPEKPEAKLTAMKVPGYSAYRLSLSLLCVGDLSSSAKALQAINDLFSTFPHEPLSGETRDASNGKCVTIPLHKLAILRSASNLVNVARLKLLLAGYEVTNREESAWKRSNQLDWSQLALQPRFVFLTSDGEEPDTLYESQKNSATESNDAIFAKDNLPEIDMPARDRSECIPGRLNYCARVWTLASNFGAAANEDAIPYIFSTLITNLLLEPILRGERRAYAASADIDSEIGMLTMYSFRDPNHETTDAFFVDAFGQIIKGNFESCAFESARQRTLSRLQDKGSFDLRCEKQFDRLLQGYDSDYISALKRAVGSLHVAQFKDSLADYFAQSDTARYALVGRQCSHSGSEIFPGLRQPI